MQTLFSDLRYALRQFRLAPVFTITAAFTLALGIGGTTAIFSLIHAIMLRSLPVADPSALYRIGSGNGCCVNGGTQDEWSMVNFPLFERLKTIVPEFEDVTAFDSYPHQVGIRREKIDRLNLPLRVEFASGNYFKVLGIRSFTGRFFSEDDDRAGSEPIAVVSYALWQGKYGGSSTLLGSHLMVDGHAFTVVGITPPGFYGETLRSTPPDVWLPLQQEPLVKGQNSLLRQPLSAWLRVIGRLKPGASTAGMSARLTAYLRQWLMHESGWPAEFMGFVEKSLTKQVLNVVPAGSGVMAMKEEYGKTLYVLLTVCSLVLAIACANIANLMLARGMVRRSDISLRVALGASPGRLIRQSLTESVTLALLGGLLGIIVADVAGRLILTLAFDADAGNSLNVGPSLPVLSFALLASLLTGILFGTAPAWFATRTRPVEALRGANRTTRDSSNLPQKSLLILQATLSVVLVAGAGMLTRSLSNLERQDFGLNPHDLLSVQLNPVPSSYTRGQLDTLHNNLLARLKDIKGVQSAALSLYNPYTDNWGEGVYVQGQKDANPQNNNASWDRVTPDFFSTIGQPIVKGRPFNDHDRNGSALVAIVNEAFVRKYLSKTNPLGQRFGLDLPAEASRFEVVGVVRDAKYTDLAEAPRPMFFLPLAQYVNYPNELMAKLESRSHLIYGMMLKTRRDVGSIQPDVRRVLSEVDPNLTLVEVRKMDEMIAMNFNQQRAVARLAGLFGTVALILASVGLYGVTAYTVARRTSEIGIRMALGAGRDSIVALVLRGAFQQVGLGLLIGIPLAVAAGRAMASQLYGMSIADPAAMVVAVLALSIAALIAAIIPAGRAASIDPIRALRTE